MAEEVISCGPRNTKLLYLQKTHVSSHVWNGEGNKELTVRRSILKRMEPPPQILPYLAITGFYEISHVRGVPIDNGLINALIKRWRPETHTFHMPFGECSITLQDVALILGLRINNATLTVGVQLFWLICIEKCAKQQI